MKKRLVILLVVVAILGGVSYGGFRFYQNYQDTHTVADVTSVASLNWGYYGSDMESSGIVTNDIAQQIYLDSQQTVDEVYVTEGDTVAIGDPLLKYDMTSITFSIEMKQLDIETIQNDTAIANRDLSKLQATTPVDKTPPADPYVPSTETQTKEPTVAEMDGSAYNYITTTAVPYTGDGSSSKPYCFICTPGSYVTGTYLNYLRTNKLYAQFEIREGNVSTGALISSWTMNGATLAEVDNDVKWSISERNEVQDFGVIDTEEPEIWVEPDGYSKDELDKAIKDKQNAIRDLDVKLRTAKLELTKLKKQAEDATVYATINGTVKSVQDPDNLSNDGSPFLSVVGSDGLYVKGQISELTLDNISEGQAVYITSWQSGMMYDAVITDVSQYPVDGSNGYYYGGGNPNSSYYDFTAFIENSDGLNNGESVSLTITANADEAATSALYIEKAYVRKENGKYYVLKENADGRLEKQYVSTGKTVYGSAIEIKSGITEDDYIAFPYGKTAKEGVRVNRADTTYYG